MKQLTVRKARQDEISWINKCYDEVDFVHSNFNREIIAIAEVDSQKAGLGRLVSISLNNFELGGMYVFASFRGRGAAGQIVEFLLSHVKPEETVYCIPFQELIPFYQKFGFNPCIDLRQVPEEILKKFQWCQGQYSKPTSLLVLRSPSRKESGYRQSS